jgi:hypothetical protein
MDWDTVFAFDDIKVLEEHRCFQNTDEDTFVLYCDKLWCNSHGWLLARLWIAGEEEVFDGEADHIGEIKQRATISIQFCPFCGIKLNS